MEVDIIKYPNDDDWKIVKEDALSTIGKSAKTIPDSDWKRKILRSEHSPIRDLVFHWKWKAMKSWVSVHFCRHHIGVEKFVSTQRNDRQGKYDRDLAPQSSPVNLKMTANAQAIINISRKRLCSKASSDTRMAWKMFLETLKDSQPELYNLCVRECVYRNGLCPEFETCGFMKSAQFKDELKGYRENFEEVYSENTSS